METGAPGVFFDDPKEGIQALLAATRDGSPSLELRDKNGTTRAALGVTTTVHKVTGAETKTAENTTVIWQAPR
jgi:hypothetical protein